MGDHPLPARQSVPACFRVLALLVLALSALVLAGCMPYDNAADSAYDDGWQDGDAGGWGFAAGWDLEPQTGNTAQVGHVITTSVNNNALGDNAPVGDIDTAGRAWGLYANSGQQAAAYRDFNGSLPLGGQLTLFMDNGAVADGGQVGVTGRNAANESLLRVYFTGGDANYTIEGDTAIDSGLAWTEEGVAITVTLITTGSYRLQLGHLGGPPVVVMGSLDDGNGDQNLTRIRLFNDNAGASPFSDVYFNEIKYSPPQCYARVGDEVYGSADVSAIQAALDAAAAGATVKVAGTCAGVLNKPINTIDQSVHITQSVTLEGGYNIINWTTPDPASSPTIIDALDLGRVVYIDAPGAAVVLKGLTLQGGNAPEAGGIFNDSASLDIVDSLIVDNQAHKGSGGGILHVDGALTLANTQVLSNTATDHGGGIFTSRWYYTAAPESVDCLAPQSDTPAVTLQGGSELRGNSAYADGGGLYSYYHAVVVDGSTIHYNQANNGGGLYIDGHPGCPPGAGPALAESSDELLLTVTNGSLIAYNRATAAGPGVLWVGTGGGILNYLSRAEVYGSSLVGNVAEAMGGGLANIDGVVVLSAAQVLSNTAQVGGGGLASTSTLVASSPSCPSSSPAVSSVVAVGLFNSELRDNTAAFMGGGIANIGTHVLLDGTTLAGSTAAAGGGLYSSGELCPFASARAASDVDYATVMITNNSLVTGNQAVGLPDAPEPAFFQGIGLGGGLFTSQSSVIVDNSQFVDNHAVDSGGALASLSASVVVSGSAVLSNTAEYGSGGGLKLSYADQPQANCVSAAPETLAADVRIVGSTLAHNTAAAGGGAVASDGPAYQVESTQVTANTASLGGGLHYAQSFDCLQAKQPANGLDHVVVIGSEITANQVSSPELAAAPVIDQTVTVSAGGGLYAAYASVGVYTTTVSGNAAGDGAGLFLYASELTVESSGIYTNTAWQSGGGLMLLDSSASLTNSTLSSNEADNDGGGLALASFGVAAPGFVHSAELHNVTAVYNTADRGQNLFTSSGSIVLRNTIVAGSPDDNCFNAGGHFGETGYNLDDGGTCSLDDDATDLYGADPMLGPLADNGGPTLTHALLPGSPAIDAGACDFDHDQRGEPRPDVPGGSCDMGAYERGSVYQVWLPVFVNTKPDLSGSFTLNPDKTTFAAGEPVTVTVVVTNVGTAATSTGFWVDLSLNPAAMPGPNLPWYHNCSASPCRGLAWYVNVSLAPGQSITLTSTPGSYAPGHTVWDGHFPAGTEVAYLFVDSWNPTSPSAAVDESNEQNNAYKSQPLSVGGSAAAQSAALPKFPDRWVRPVE